MRKLLTLLFALVALPALAAGPKMSNTGGIGSATSTYTGPGGELTGGTYTINGATGAFNGKIGPASSVLGDTGAVSRTQDSRNRDVTRITDFCVAANLNGTTDNTTCIQAAVTAMCARTYGGGTLYFPASYQYAISAATGVSVACAGITIAGDGWGDHTHSGNATIINVIGSGSADIFIIASSPSIWRAGRYTPPGGVRDLMIKFTNTNTARTQTGWGINIGHCEGCIVQNVRIWAPQNGIRNYAGIMNRVTQTQITQVVNNGIAILVTGSDAACAGNIGGCPDRSDIFTVDQTLIDFMLPLASGQQNADCIIVRDFVATVWIKNTGCNGPRRGLVIECPTSASMAACPAFITVYDLEAEVNDLGTGNGVMIDARDFGHFVCIGCQGYGYSAVVGLQFQSSRFAHASGDVQIIGGRYSGASASCVISSVDQTFFGAGFNVQNCGTSGAGFFALDLRGSTGFVNSQTVDGADLCRDINDATTKTYGGIKLSSGQDYNVITNNRLRSCLTGVTDSSGGTHNIIANNTTP